MVGVQGDAPAFDSVYSSSSKEERKMTDALASQIAVSYERKASLFMMGVDDATKTRSVQTEVMRMWFYILVWFVVGTQAALTVIFVPESQIERDYINSKLGYPHICYYMDYYPARQIGGMLFIFPITCLFFYSLFQYLQVDSMVGHPDIPSIGSKWLFVRFYGIFVKSLCAWTIYLSLLWSPDESYLMHLIGYTVFSGVIVYNEVEQTWFYIALERNRAGGLPFQEYLGRFAKPAWITRDVMLVVLFMVKQIVFWCHTVFDTQIYDITDTNQVAAMRILDIFTTIIGAVLPIFAANNLCKKSAPVMLTNWLNDKAVHRFSINREFGYSNDEWALAIAEQRKYSAQKV